jgi:pilus assembly protein CpaE
VILVIDPASELTEKIGRVVPGARIQREPDLGGAERFLEERSGEIEVIVLGPMMAQTDAIDIGRKLREQHPVLSIVVASMAESPAFYRQAMRAGIADVLPWEADPEEIRDVLTRTAEQTARLRAGEPTEEAHELARVYATFSTKGGCGKSFIATNLAVQLAATYPGEVVLFDLDLQAGDAAIMLQLMPEHGVLEAVQMGEDLDEVALAGFMTPTADGTLKVLAAPSHPVYAEEIAGVDVGRVLGLLRRMFRYVVVDSPPSFNDHVLAAMDLVDTVLVVSSLDVPSIKNLKLSVETLAQLGISRNRMKLVLNRADSKVGLTVREVEKSLGTTIDITIPSSREVPFAVNQGIPIVTARPKAPVSKALNEALRIVDGAGPRPIEEGREDRSRSLSRRRRR